MCFTSMDYLCMVKAFTFPYFPIYVLEMGTVVHMG